MKRYAGALREYLRGSLWVMPTAAVIAALALALALVRVETTIETGTFLDIVVFGGGAEGARAVLEMVAGSVITITSLVFTLTVVALQLAANTYSPRVLRNFLRDRGTQVTLSLFLATFAYSYVVLRTIRSEVTDQEAFVPQLAVTMLMPLVFASIGALVYFIHHITQAMRVDRILGSVSSDTLAAVDRLYSEQPTGIDGEVPQDVPDDVMPIHANASGTIQLIEPAALARAIAEDDLVIRFRRMVGDHVLSGTVLAWAWSRAGGQPSDPEKAAELVHDAVYVGAERTMQQDAGFGLRQLVDVALRALSTGLNDPTTASQSLEHMGRVLGRLVNRGDGPRVELDEGGIARVIVPRLDFSGHLALACDQLRVYGAKDPAVMTSLLRMLGDLAQLTDDPQRLQTIAEQIDQVTGAAEEGLVSSTDRSAVRSIAEALRPPIG